MLIYIRSRINPNRLKYHIFKPFKIKSVIQTTVLATMQTAHILQSCPIYNDLRNKIKYGLIGNRMDVWGIYSALPFS